MSIASYTTKSGKVLSIGTGTGTKWQWLKKGRPQEERDSLLSELVDQVATALKAGFRHIDTAEQYTTHPEVAAAIEKIGVAREDVWITTKYTPGFFGIADAPSKGPLASLDKALKELKTDYLDCFLIHSPFFEDKMSHGQTLETAWQEMIEAKKQGKVRYIGVSNFAQPHLETCFKVAGGNKEYYPKFNQIEFHPYLQNQSKNIVNFCQENGILVEAFGPLTPLFRIKEGDKDINDHPLTVLLPKLAEKYGKTEAQVLLRYTIQKNIIPITTSSKIDRINESLAVYDFELENEDIIKIDQEGAKYKFRGFFGKLYDQFE